VRVLALKLGKTTVSHRLIADGRAFLDDPKRPPQIEESWRLIFQEPLFPEPKVEHEGAGDRGDHTPDEPPPSSGRPERSRPKRRKSE
jgi:hypothetical protein